MELPSFFLELSKLYKEHGFSLYLVGGTSRDMLLGNSPSDFDLTTDATVEEEKNFLPDFNSCFAKFGSIKLNFSSQEIDITTFRKEGCYLDHRHPSSISFVKDMKIDSMRRDFTINAIYIDDKGKIYDFYSGQSDLKNRVLRFIGDPNIRIQEDPLRILRAERFARRLNFQIEEKSLEAINRNRDLLKLLNPNKVEMEMKKG